MSSRGLLEGYGLRPASYCGPTPVIVRYRDGRDLEGMGFPTVGHSDGYRPFTPKIKGDKQEAPPEDE